MRVGVITFPGTLDDRDAARAVVAGGAEAVSLWHGDADLKSVDAVVLPGGFSYGDYLRCGAISRFAPVMQLVIEAATENQAVKEKILKQVDEIVSKETIIATNTSSLSITKLAALDSNPGRFIGMHFFNPPPLMALVEVIRGLQTSDTTHAAIIEMAKRIGKEPITVKNSPGFVVNRILLPMINEAFFVLHEGLASPEDIDAGMKLGCNQPIGPLALADLIGLDTCLAVMEVYFENFSDSKYRPCPLLREMVAAGYLGRKSGRGVFTYDQ